MHDPRHTAATLSQLDRAGFVAALDGIFEHSPWIAERTWHRRPFPNREVLMQSLLATLHDASRADQLALIRAHPELAGRAAMRGELTADSTHEQAGAGLTACTPQEFEHLHALNAAYNERFGFPFILAVRGLSRHDIIEAMEKRVGNPPELEFEESLIQIGRIARLRLEERIAG